MEASAVKDQRRGLATVAALLDLADQDHMVAFLVTAAGVPMASIGAAFWGLVAGFTVSWLMEKRDFQALANAS